MNSKAASDRYQRQVLELVRQTGNDTCADCKGRAPRWSSWNLGVFLCVQCAGIHRKMGTHISKVKSLTLDTWTKEQIQSMKDMGNVKSNAIYNPDEMRNRPPTNMEESERDSELEKFIRRKYEFRRFMEKRPPPVPTKDASARRPPPSPRMVSSSNNTSFNSPPNGSSTTDSYFRGEDISRSRTAPIPSSWSEAQERASPKPALPNRDSSRLALPGSSPNVPPLPARAASASLQQAVGSSSSSLAVGNGAAIPRSNSAAPAPVSSTQSQIQPSANSSVFDDLLSLSDPSPATPQPPLQMNPWAAMQQNQQAVSSPMNLQSSPYSPYHPNGHSNSQPAISINGTGMGMNNGGGVGMGMNGFQQQQQQNRSASLGNMAFSSSPQPSTGSLSPNPFMNGGMGMNQYGSSPGMMNQQHSGMMGISNLNTNYSGMPNQNSFPSSPTNPYSNSPISPVNPYLSSHSPVGFSSSPSNPYSQQQIPQQQQQQPQQNQNQQFTSWAGGMMPQGMQGNGAMYGNSYQQQQQQQNQNMWG